MVARNTLLAAPPYPVERALKRVGANLRKARLRRNLTIEQAADKIGTGPRAVMDAEKGKASTGVAVYTALLWLYGLLRPFEDLADPAADKEGMAREPAKERARRSGELDSDF